LHHLREHGLGVISVSRRCYPESCELFRRYAQKRTCSSPQRN